MEAYPPQYVEHNLPLVLLSGLGEHETTDDSLASLKRQESGARIVIESPECQNERSEQVLREFMSLDGRALAWNSDLPPSATSTMRYRIKTMGRAYTLPARKAAPLPQSPGADGSSPPRNTELHSPLSPLSPGSGVFPDGLMTPFWFSKHQQQVPALLLAFFDLNSGEGPSQDEQLKSDINVIRAALTRSGFKTRFAVVLMSDQSILHVPELEERLASIRRATLLDPKSGLFFMPPMSSHAEIATFIQSIVMNLQPACIDYYRDLTKHARRKKARGGPPPQVSTTGGASHTTSTSGWNVRYEVKQGVFAEFRQEMEIAERHYAAAMEELFSLEGGVFETTASWNPRWDEARLLCDALAIRVLRCQLWRAQTTGAAQSWQNYKLRMRDLVDRRGKGSNTYGWDAWEARWAEVMAQLITIADVPSLQRSVKDAAGEYSAQKIYATPERPTDHLLAFHFLHHPGYWIRLLAHGIRSRWAKAMAIPEEDRVPPGQSPASTVAKRSKNYDVYMVPEPHEEAVYNHAGELKGAFSRAVEEFDARRQLRMGEQMRLELAEDLIRVGQYADALKELIQIWEQTTWRDDEWQVPFARLLKLLSECAIHDRTKQNANVMLALTWETLSVALPDTPEGSISLTKCLDSWSLDTPLNLRLYDKQRLSPIRPYFAFKEREGHVGEALECQITLAYRNLKGAAPIIEVSSLYFKIGTRTICLIDEASKEAAADGPEILAALVQHQELEDGTLNFSGDLRLRPSQRKTFTVSLVMRDSQACFVEELNLTIKTPKFALTHCFEDAAIQPSAYWIEEQAGALRQSLLQRVEPRSINVLPKPPKMQVLLHGLRKDYYTDELVHLDVELVNDEIEAVHATTALKIVGPDGDTVDFRWANGEDETIWTITGMEASATRRAELLVQAPPEVATLTISFDLRYTLVSDVNTPLTKTVSVEIPFVMPFEAKFTFGPQLHSDLWPSFFEPRVDQDTPDGIIQSWKVTSHIRSLIGKPFEIRKLELLEHQAQGDVVCMIANSIVSERSTLPSNGTSTSTFEITTQKLSLDDRRPSYLDLSLVVTWSMSDDKSAEEAMTTISVPRLTIPTSEPRVLCTRAAISDNDAATIEYHLENPSIHFLTFALTMEASEDFSFSGPKYRTLSLAPLSRHCVIYQLLVPDRTSDWVSPTLQVMDSYYQKSLRVHPGGHGVKMNDRKEVSVWVGKGKAPE